MPADSTPGARTPGCRTRSVTRPRATVTATEATANTNAPTTEIRNGRGCARTCEAISRIPRPNSPRGSSSMRSAASTNDAGPWQAPSAVPRRGCAGCRPIGRWKPARRRHTVAHSDRQEGEMDADLVLEGGGVKGIGPASARYEALLKRRLPVPPGRRDLGRGDRRGADRVRHADRGAPARHARGRLRQVPGQGVPGPPRASSARGRRCCSRRGSTRGTTCRSGSTACWAASASAPSATCGSTTPTAPCRPSAPIDSS